MKSCSANMIHTTLQSMRSSFLNSAATLSSQTYRPFLLLLNKWCACVCVCVYYMYLKWSIPSLLLREASDLSMTQRVVQDEDELSTFVNIQSESAALFITAAHCLCERWLERVSSPQKKNLRDWVPISFSVPL